MQIASIYTQPLFLLLQCLLLGDSVSGKRTLAVPSCYLFMCKVEKLPFLIQPYWTSMIFYSATSSLHSIRREKVGIILPRLDEMNLFLHSSSRHTLLLLFVCNEEKLAQLPMPTSSQFPEQVEGIYLCKHNPYVCGTQSSISHLQPSSGDEKRSERSPVTAFPSPLSSSAPRKITFGYFC